MRSSWWKVLSVLLLAFTIIGGILMPVPRLHILNETIRNLYFHVPMWFAMMALFTAAMVYSIKYLRSNDLKDDIYAVEFTKTGIAFSIYGMATGMEWANYTWGSPWSNDPKELGTALCMLTYFAYAILRGGLKDEEKRAKISAVYNIFAFALIVPLLWVLPRMVDSLHPGNGGNPAFKKYDLDSDMRMVFYPAILGWILLSFWIATLKIRTSLISYRRENNSLNPKKYI
ncbi:MAG TPA: cytochrome c biogenesis protein CcsA [Flavipsychrobacter sp.]|nr:cytochrome c biogenesis protein CcsA [Flavipsychrobacter sp.]